MSISVEVADGWVHGLSNWSKEDCFHCSLTFKRQIVLLFNVFVATGINDDEVKTK